MKLRTLKRRRDVFTLRHARSRAEWEAHHNWFEVDDWDDGDDDSQDGPACGHCGAGVNTHDEDECWHCGADL